MSEQKKYRQICREAKWTGAVLLFLIVFWLIAGFGVSQCKTEIFHLPLWAVTSTVGMWLMAIIAVKFLVKFVFRDMDFAADGQISEENDGDNTGGGK